MKSLQDTRATYRKGLCNQETSAFLLYLSFCNNQLPAHCTSTEEALLENAGGSIFHHVELQATMQAGSGSAWRWTGPVEGIGGSPLALPCVLCPFCLASNTRPGICLYGHLHVCLRRAFASQSLVSRMLCQPAPRPVPRCSRLAARLVREPSSLAASIPHEPMKTLILDTEIPDCPHTLDKRSVMGCTRFRAADSLWGARPKQHLPSALCCLKGNTRISAPICDPRRPFADHEMEHQR